MEKKIIGRKDIVSFPQFGLYNVPVKIDTGAYSSSMHCHSVELKDSVLRIVFLDPSIEGYTGKVFEFSNFKRKTVKSSNGIAEQRYFIPVVIRLFNTDYEAWFSLTVRTGLRNPVLLGRKLLNKRFLVDPSLTNCSRNFELKNPL